MKTGREAFNFKHGHCLSKRPSPEYRAWQNMRNRCNKTNDERFKYYGARGITICARWADFANFLADMGPRPSSDHSIDRINNHGPYSPENCRWATRIEQMRNLRNTVYLTHEDQTRPLQQWAEILGVRAKTIKSRLHKGWTVARALMEPIDKSKRNGFAKPV